MSEPHRVGLDNPALRARLRSPRYRTRYSADNSRPSQGLFYDQPVKVRTLQQEDVPSTPTTITAPIAVVEPQPSPKIGEAIRYQPKYSKLQLSLIGMACFVFVFGVGTSVQTLLTNHNATAQVSALSKKADQGASTSDVGVGGEVPSTTKPSQSAYRNYVVAPDLARYISIPKLSIKGRVLQVGVNKDGGLATPNNVYDAAWYTGSTKPGQLGATLIDGHVSSWTTHGVFYGIKKLVAGDNIDLTLGNNSVLNYRVVKTVVYDIDKVDMQAAVMPVTPGKPGLNLITCTGKLKPGTNDFQQRVIVFAEQI